MQFKEHIQDSEILKLVAEVANKEGVKTYVVGGYVRDLLINKADNRDKDIDFVCLGGGIDFAGKVANRTKGKLITFKNFGTAMLKYKGAELEFVGARKESYRSESRKPIVEDGTLQDDQNRRDFTINALAISLNNEDLGSLVDPFNGVSDLKKKIIRTPLDPAITFSDDPLRMMRAIRFSSQLNFDIEPETFDAIKKNAERIQIVSEERVIDELNKIVLSAKPSYGFNLLFESGLLKIIFPEMVHLAGVESIDGQKHKDNFYHTLKVLDNVAEVSTDLWLRWAAILHDIAKPATKRFDKKVGWTFHGHEDKGARMVPGIFRRLKLPLNENMKFVQKLVKLHLRPIALVKDTVTDSAIRRLLFEAGEDIDSLMKLCRADITSKNHQKVKRYLQNFDKVERKMHDLEEKDRIRNFQPPVSGEQIMETFGLKPCKLVGEIKEEIKEAIIEGKISNNFDEAFAYMLSIGKSNGLEIINEGKTN